MKVAIIRGQNLNKFEMQNYEPLREKHDLTAYATFNHRFDIDEINIKTKELHCPEEFVERLPFPLKNAFSSLLYRSEYDSYMIGLEKELEDKDIAHVAETCNGYTYQAVRAKERYNRPKVIVTVWENIPFRRTGSHVVQVGKKADAFVAITERAGRALLLEGIEKERIHVVPVGVDLERFKPRPKSKVLLDRLGLSTQDFIILFIGRLTWEKGVYDLIYTEKMISQDPELRGKPIKYILIGSGPEKENVLQMANMLGISDKTILAGDVPYLQVHEFHNLADIFVLPSIPTRQWQEQFGMVLVEAMASGTPVISTLSGSIPEVVGHCGVLVQPNDPTSLYQAIKTLVLDETTRKEIRGRALSRAQEEFDCRNIAHQIDEIYGTVT